MVSIRTLLKAFRKENIALHFLSVKCKQVEVTDSCETQGLFVTPTQCSAMGSLHACSKVSLRPVKLKKQAESIATHLHCKTKPSSTSAQA